MAEAIAAGGAHLIVTHPIEAGDNLALYRLIGGVFGHAREAEALCAQFEAAHGRVLKAARALPERGVLYLIWKDPWMTVSRDTYISRTLGLVNWRTARHDDAVRYPVVEMSKELLDVCDLVLFSSEPFPFNEAHLEEFGAAFPAHAAKARLIDAEMVSWYGQPRHRRPRLPAPFGDGVTPPRGFLAARLLLSSRPDYTTPGIAEPANIPQAGPFKLGA